MELDCRIMLFQLLYVHSLYYYPYNCLLSVLCVHTLLLSLMTTMDYYSIVFIGFYSAFRHNQQAAFLNGNFEVVCTGAEISVWEAIV